MDDKDTSAAVAVIQLGRSTIRSLRASCQDFENDLKTLEEFYDLQSQEVVDADMMQTSPWESPKKPATSLNTFSKSFVDNEKEDNSHASPAILLDLGRQITQSLGGRKVGIANLMDWDELHTQCAKYLETNRQDIAREQAGKHTQTFVNLCKLFCIQLDIANGERLEYKRKQQDKVIADRCDSHEAANSSKVQNSGVPDGNGSKKTTTRVAHTETDIYDGGVSRR